LLSIVGSVEQFSARFLRESSVFPFRIQYHGFGLAVSDPSDGAAIRAAEIVCGGPVTIAVASFDDIATVLERRLDERTADAVDVAEPERRPGDDDIDSLRDLASGAPVVRAVNDLLERALELRASAGRAGRDRYPYRHHADAARRERGDPSLAARSRLARTEQDRIGRPRRIRLAPSAGAAAWIDPDYRPDRKRQDNDAGDNAVDPQ